jgi:hypothetical protein
MGYTPKIVIQDGKSGKMMINYGTIGYPIFRQSHAIYKYITGE